MYDTGLGCTDACLADSQSQCSRTLDLRSRTTPASAPAPGTRLLVPRLRASNAPQLSTLHEMMQQSMNNSTDHTCTDETQFKTFCLKYFLHQLQTAGI